MQKREEELTAAMIAAAGQTSETGDDKPADTSQGQEIVDIEPKPEITYDDFAKLQFQVGEIIACEAVPKSKKLLCSSNCLRRQAAGICPPRFWPMAAWMRRQRFVIR
mgnify:CR=1 FL=1